VTDQQQLPSPPAIPTAGLQYEESDEELMNGLLFFPPNSQLKIKSVYTRIPTAILLVLAKEESERQIEEEV
jgi:hypothetical protein